MRISVARGIVKLKDLPNGSLFVYKNTIALKTEYLTEAMACECFIVGTGEMFWGGTKSAEELNELVVTPVIINV
jgi:hypothetical protein